MASFSCCASTHPCCSSTRTSSATPTSSSHPMPILSTPKRRIPRHDWIFDDYSPAISSAFDAEKLPYHHGAPYDFFASIFGDTVPAVGFHAAGMTFEKDNRDRVEDRTMRGRGGKGEHSDTLWET